MAASCMFEKYGLYPYHAYTLLGVLDLQKNGASYKKLLKIRNPFGDERYNGPWHDGDKQWTDEFKKQANLVIASDGIFYMPFEIFDEVYPYFYVVMYQDWNKQ